LASEDDVYESIENCNMNAFFSFDLFMVYIPECKQQLRTMKKIYADTRYRTL